MYVHVNKLELHSLPHKDLSIPMYEEGFPNVTMNLRGLKIVRIDA